MNKKLAIQFRKSEKTRYHYLRLKYCPHCDNFSVLWQPHCDVCGREHSYIPVEAITQRLARRNRQIQLLGLIVLLSFSVFVSGTMTELIVSLVSSLLLLIGFRLMQQQFAEVEKMTLLDRYLQGEGTKIRQALLRHIQQAVTDAKASRYKDAYEKLREVGHFLHDDTVKIRKIMYLNHFILRKDMDLELDTLIPSRYDRDFITYLREVAKLKPALLKKRVLDYCLLHRDKIRGHEHGNEVLTHAAGAALRMKAYVDRYQVLILDMLEHLPKERLLRLAKLLKRRPAGEWPELYARTLSLITTKHAFDPDFHEWTNPADQPQP